MGASRHRLGREEPSERRRCQRTCRLVRLLPLRRVRQAAERHAFPGQARQGQLELEVRESTQHLSPHRNFSPSPTDRLSHLAPPPVPPVTRFKFPVNMSQFMKNQRLTLQIWDKVRCVVSHSTARPGILLGVPSRGNQETYPPHPPHVSPLYASPALRRTSLRTIAAARPSWISPNPGSGACSLERSHGRLTGSHSTSLTIRMDQQSTAFAQPRRGRRPGRCTKSPRRCSQRSPYSLVSGHVTPPCSLPSVAAHAPLSAAFLPLLAPPLLPPSPTAI